MKKMEEKLLYMMSNYFEIDDPNGTDLLWVLFGVLIVLLGMLAVCTAPIWW